jgi:hypothetical protein
MPFFRKTPHHVPGGAHPLCIPVHGNNLRAESQRDTHNTVQMAPVLCCDRHLPCTGSWGTWDTGVLPITFLKCLKKKKKSAGNYNPTTRSIAPTRMPNMDVDADNIPKRIYPTIAPIFNGVYVRLRFNLRIVRKDFVSGDISGLFCLIRIMNVHLISCAGDSLNLLFGPVFILVRGPVYIIRGISYIKSFLNNHTLIYWKMLGFTENKPQITVNFEYCRMGDIPE